MKPVFKEMYGEVLYDFYLRHGELYIKSLD